jgi:hypothetical protein
MQATPTNITEADEKKLVELSIQRAMAEGLAIKLNDHFQHAPFTLHPSPFPQSAYEYAIKIQPLFNLLVDRVARNHNFIAKVMEELKSSDDFTKRIYEIYLKNRDNKQKIWVGFHRSDYIVHNENGTKAPKQVERIV